jgi:hypothetical protein
MRSIRPVLGDHFLFIREIGTDRDEVPGLLHKCCGAERRGGRSVHTGHHTMNNNVEMQRRGGPMVVIDVAPRYQKTVLTKRT